MSGIAPQDLSRFNPLGGLSQDELLVLASKASVRQLAARGCLFRSGSSDDWAYYLLSGRLQLTADDGRTITLDADGEAARNPISQLCPRKYTVAAVTPAAVLRIERELLENVVANLSEGRHAAGTYEMESVDRSGGDGGVESYEIVSEVLEQKLELPSLAEGAAQIRRKLRCADLSALDLVKIIQADPALTVKVIKAAGSALYRARGPVRTCREAVQRLGIETTKDVVGRFASARLLEGDGDDEAVTRCLEQWLQHSLRVAAISNVLAHLTSGLDPEVAATAGLLHGIGALAVLSYARRHAGMFADGAALAAGMAELGGPAGAEILRHWGFDEAIVASAREADHWRRDAAPAPDYCDLVIVARLYSFHGRPHPPRLPSVYEVPAFAKIAGGRLDPSLSFAILNLAEEQIATMQRLFAA